MSSDALVLELRAAFVGNEDDFEYSDWAEAKGIGEDEGLNAACVAEYDKLMGVWFEEEERLREEKERARFEEGQELLGT